MRKLISEEESVHIVTWLNDFLPQGDKLFQWDLQKQCPWIPMYAPFSTMAVAARNKQSSPENWPGKSNWNKYKKTVGWQETNERGNIYLTEGNWNAVLPKPKQHPVPAPSAAATTAPRLFPTPPPALAEEKLEVDINSVRRYLATRLSLLVDKIGVDSTNTQLTIIIPETEKPAPIQALEDAGIPFTNMKGCLSISVKNVLAAMKKAKATEEETAMANAQSSVLQQ